MMTLKKKNSGFSLIEIFISLAIYGTVVSGVVSYLSTNKRVNRQVDIDATMEANLRIGMDRVVGSIRNAGYGIPDSGLDLWLPWIPPGFTNQAIVITDGNTASDPDIISVASCTSKPVMTLTTAASPGDTPLIVDDTSLVNTGEKLLISIDESEFAHIYNVNATTKTLLIDTDVTTHHTVSAEGVTKGYFVGAEICRVDVTTFDIDSNKLRRDKNHGAGPERLVDEIVDMQIETITPDLQYKVTLTARSDRKGSDGVFPSRSLTTFVTLKN